MRSEHADIGDCINSQAGYKATPHWHCNHNRSDAFTLQMSNDIRARITGMSELGLKPGRILLASTPIWMICSSSLHHLTVQLVQA